MTKTLKLIYPEQVEDLAVRDASEALEVDENYLENKLLFIDSELYTQFVAICTHTLKSWRDLEKSEEKSKKSMIDFILFNEMRSVFNLKPNMGGSIDFWNSLIIQTPIALELVDVRWGYSKGWFRKDIHPSELNYNEVRRYAVSNSSDLYRLTFQRIWILSMLTKEEHIEVILKNQDFMEYVLGLEFAKWLHYNARENRLIAPVLDIIYEELQKWDNLKAKNKIETYSRDLFTRQFFKFFTVFHSGCLTTTLPEEELRDIIVDFFDVAASIIGIKVK